MSNLRKSSHTVNTKKKSLDLAQHQQHSSFGSYVSESCHLYLCYVTHTSVPRLMSEPRHAVTYISTRKTNHIATKKTLDICFDSAPAVICEVLLVDLIYTSHRSYLNSIWMSLFTNSLFFVFSTCSRSHLRRSSWGSHCASFDESSTWIHMWDETHLFVWHNAFIHGIWLIYMRDTVRHKWKSFITHINSMIHLCLMEIRICKMTNLYARHDSAPQW